MFLWELDIIIAFHFTTVNLKFKFSINGVQNIIPQNTFWSRFNWFWFYDRRFLQVAYKINLHYQRYLVNI